MQTKAVFVREFEVIFDCLMEDLINYGECRYKAEAGINPIVFSAYCWSKKDGNSRINFGDDLDPEDVADIVSSLRKHGITEFTLSPTLAPAGVTSTLAAFKKLGFVARDKVNIKGFNGKEVPALLVRAV
ncbi:MAG: hypothetical protein IJT02_08405 [Synergistaceae bacterium]|nr:hypothetical protein [Synergistaceae bacterium]